MKCLLIGGLGYLGARLAQYLQTQGHEVTVTTRRPASAFPSWSQEIGRVVSLPSDSTSFDRLLDGQDNVIHLAGPDEVEAQKSPKEALRATENSIQCVLNALTRHSKPPPLLYLSTFHVYGRTEGRIQEDTPPKPVHPYAAAKYAGEQWVEAYNKQKRGQGLRVRLSNGFGAPLSGDIPRWTLVFNDLCRQAVEKRHLTLKSSGQQQRNFITVTDIARAIEFLLQHTSQWPSDGLIHLGSSLQWSIQDVAQKVAARAQVILGFTPPISVATQTETTPMSFEFSLERLRSLGFTWVNNWQDEVDATLRLCNAHR